MEGMNTFTRPDPTTAQMLGHLRQAADIARAAIANSLQRLPSVMQKLL